MEQAKKLLRRLMQARRDAHDPKVASHRSRLAQEYILTSPIWRQAVFVGLYMPIGSEADTGLLFSTALATGKKLYLPKITNKEEKLMQFAPCLEPSDLQPGLWNILEPPAGPQPEKLDILVIPGLAFDYSGGRLGYGGGYYDRYLDAHPGFANKTLGFCFAFQIADHIPRDPWDYNLSGVCSEDGLLWL